MADTPTSLATGAGRRRRAEELAAFLPPLQVAAERVAATVAQGVHGRRRVGQGEAFWQFRRYQPGDTQQRIDWRQSAKSQHLFVRETEWEAAQSVWLWRDGSPSMHYRSDRELPFKVERAEVLLIALMALLIGGGERIALLDEPGRPASGRLALNRLAFSVLSQGETDASLPGKIHLPRHATVVMIGDFLAPLEETDAILRAYAAMGVRGYVLQVLDQAEVTMPFRGRSRFAGLEAEGDLMVGKAEGLRDAYLERLHDHEGALETLVQTMGWGFSVHHTNNPPQAALLALYTHLVDLDEF